MNAKDKDLSASRLLAEKLVDLFRDESPVPNYISPKIESLLEAALHEVRAEEIRINEENKKIWCDQVKIARAAGYQEGFLAGASSESIRTQTKIVRKEAYEQCAKIVEQEAVLLGIAADQLHLFEAIQIGAEATRLSELANELRACKEELK